MRTTTTLTDLAPIFDELRASGLTRLADFATALNERGIRTPNGKGQWHAAGVSRVYMAILIDRARAKRGKHAACNRKPPDLPRGSLRR